MKPTFLVFLWKVRGVMANVLDYGLEVNEFEIQLQYCVHFLTNTLRKGINLLISPPMGLIISLLFSQKDEFVNK